MSRSSGCVTGCHSPEIRSIVSRELKETARTGACPAANLAHLPQPTPRHGLPHKAGSPRHHDISRQGSDPSRTARCSPTTHTYGSLLPESHVHRCQLIRSLPCPESNDPSRTTSHSPSHRLRKEVSLRGTRQPARVARSSKAGSSSSPTALSMTGRHLAASRTAMGSPLRRVQSGIIRKRAQTRAEHGNEDDDDDGSRREPAG